MTDLAPTSTVFGLILAGQRISLLILSPCPPALTLTKRQRPLADIKGRNLTIPVGDRYNPDGSRTSALERVAPDIRLGGF